MRIWIRINFAAVLSNVTIYLLEMGSAPIDWVMLLLTRRRVQAGTLSLDHWRRIQVGTISLSNGLGIPAGALFPVNVLINRFPVWRRRICLANGPIRRTSHALKGYKIKITGKD